MSHSAQTPYEMFIYCEAMCSKAELGGSTFSDYERLISACYLPSFKFMDYQWSDSKLFCYRGRRSDFASSQGYSSPDVASKGNRLTQVAVIQIMMRTMVLNLDCLAMRFLYDERFAIRNPW